MIKTQKEKYSGVFIMNSEQTIEHAIIEQNTEGELFRHEHFQLTGASHQVLVYPTWAGITDFERRVASRLNSAGFDAVIVDLFGNTQDLSTIEARKSAMHRLTRDFNHMVEHLCQLNTFICTQAGNEDKQASAMGFCLGGMCAVLTGLTRAGYMAAISFHGLLSFPKDRRPTDTTTRFMLLNGNIDPMVPEEDICATLNYFEDNQLDLTFMNFSRTLHSFSIPGAYNPDAGVMYNPDVAEQSWRYALDLLKHV
ncbi:dienelactone hydrolase [Marinobacterium halophilum]|uniref:Dienelactone hydrolase n=1 Tax=Marinobacterium halophilum TaxID=267374 RepID=A0A2P8ERJ4_9GAMM|nr:dienelactone hydrolase family protein [Marinobacterium halophilum]PSL12100.1 dienelactone hydrolase [Marinobacterium halophilum]